VIRPGQLLRLLDRDLADVIETTVGFSRCLVALQEGLIAPHVRYLDPCSQLAFPIRVPERDVAGGSGEALARTLVFVAFTATSAKCRHALVLWVCLMGRFSNTELKKFRDTSHCSACVHYAGCQLWLALLLMNDELVAPGLDLIIPDITKACPMFFPWSAESARSSTGSGGASQRRQ
jgi:hypothetical protein